MSELAEKLESGGPWDTLEALRSRAPLVHNMTNLVAMDMVANLLLAAGASPAVAQASEQIEEVDEFVALCDALTINIGSLSSTAAEAMANAAREAVAQGKPWVLDPVCAGATTLRADTARRLARLRPSVIRGNGAEILALGSGGRAQGFGLDMQIDAAEALDAAADLARKSGAVIAVTGTVDYVTDGRRIVAVANGDPLMSRVTGLGCALTSLIGACCAVEQDAVTATVDALAILGVAAELAAEQAAGPGSFRLGLLDALYSLDEPALNGGARIQ